MSGAAAADPTTQQGSGAPSPRRARRSTGTSERAGGVPRILYLPDDLLEPIRVYCATHGRTRTQLALRALEATYPDLSSLIEQDLQPTVVKGSLFDQVQPATSHANRQVEIKPTPSQLATIDKIRLESGARDRSHLLTVALRTYLTTDH